MAIEFSKRSQRTRPSAIRALFKKCVDPEIISLGGGSPAKEGFPLEEIRDITKYIIDEKTVDMLVYGLTPGYKPLREAYLKWIVEPKGVKATLDNVICFTGSGQGIDLTCEILLDEGDVVFVESPTFLGTLNVLNKRGVKLVPIPTDEHGLIVEELEKKAKELHPKMLYTIPAFQNPAGVTIPADRRQRIAELAAEYDFIVLEDDPYGDVRFRGEKVPPIKLFDKADKVIMMNSFSKTLAPGIRVGACVAPVEIAQKLEVIKQGCDTHSSTLPQAIVAEFLNRGLMEDHLKKIAPIYAERHDALVAGIRKYFPAECKFVEAEGGMFIWLKLPNHMDAKALAEKCIEQYKVAFVHGEPFCVNPEDGFDYIRLNFSGTPADKITIACERIGKAIKEDLAK